MTDDTTPPQSEPDKQPEAKATRKRFGTLDLFWLFLLGLSGFATFAGLAEQVRAGGVSLSILSGIFCLVVVGLLTGAMGATANLAFGKHRHRLAVTGRIGTTAVYAFCTFLSLTFAFAWWWGQLGAREATNGQVDVDIARIETGLGRTRQQLATAKDQLDSLADLSAKRALEESKDGGTCGTPSRGEGRVFRLRQSNSRLFGQISTDTGSRIDRLDRSMQGSLGTIAQTRKEALSAESANRSSQLGEIKRQLNGLAEQVSALSSDPGLRAYADEMETLSHAYRTSSGHAEVGGQAFTCLDQGVASALDGARTALTSIEAAPTPTFAIYEGNQATNEASRRFVATLFGWLNREALGEGINGANEYLAFALAFIVDGLLLWVTLVRGGDADGPDFGTKRRRAKQEIARRIDKREAAKLLATDAASSHATMMATLANPSLLPFTELMANWGGRTYLIIPTHAACERSGAQALEMLRIAATLDQEPGSGVREQIRFAQRRFFIFPSRDRQARSAVAALGSRSATWIQGSGFRWFKLSPKGLQILVAWANTHANVTSGAGDSDTVSYEKPLRDANGRGTNSKATLHRQTYLDPPVMA